LTRTTEHSHRKLIQITEEQMDGPFDDALTLFIADRVV
jgi:hypothetical protein